GPGIHPYERSAGHDADQGHPAAHDQLRWKLTGEHVGVPGNANECQRACRMTFLMAGGGTGGHVIPGLAVARELRARGHYVYFVGTARGIESKLVPAEGFELRMIDIGGLNRVGAAQKLATLARLPFVTLGCLKDAGGASGVFSMGGYAAGPPVMAALIRRK